MRTLSPYFSPKSAIAPRAFASAIGRSVWTTTGSSFRISALTISSTLWISLGHRLRVGEVESQPIRINARAFLMDMPAEHLAQRRLKQMGRRVVPHDVAPPNGIHARQYFLPDRCLPFRDLSGMEDQPGRALCVCHLDLERAGRYRLPS